VSDPPDWLPPLQTLPDFGGDWSVYIEETYRRFRHDFVAFPVTLEGRRCLAGRDIGPDGKELTFWHIVSEGPEERTRTPDLRRCERISWPRALIEAMDAGSEHVRWWRTTRGRDRRLVIALEDFSYVVVLSERPTYFVLITAYAAEREHERVRLRRQYEKAQNG
jgi:hypothetical protein